MKENQAGWASDLKSNRLLSGAGEAFPEVTVEKDGTNWLEQGETMIKSGKQSQCKSEMGKDHNTVTGNVLIVVQYSSQTIL